LPGNSLIETTRSTFAGNAAHVGQARRFIADVLGEKWPRLDDIVLLASEITSNAVRHTASGDGGSFDVTVFFFAAGDCVRVEVADQGSASEPKMTGADDLGGRGLRIVEVLADRWGHAGDELGRTVWFEITVKPDV
jgi:anti-sigma regulatory factor (Ser/Thr protein kinase)